VGSEEPSDSGKAKFLKSPLYGDFGL
jgi:hypothetical protein